MTALLWLVLATTAPAHETDNNEKSTSAQGGDQAALPDNPLKSVVDGISSVGQCFTGGSQITPIDNKESADAQAAIVWVRLSQDYLGDYVERDVDRTKPLRDHILGTSLSGKSRTTGRTKLILQPNEKQAGGRVEFVGNVHSRAIGHNGPAVLHYNAASTFRGHKQLTVTESGVVASPAVVHASTRLTPTNIYANLPGLRGRIGGRIARRREAASRGQANAIASDHTADDVRHGFDRRLNDAVAKIQSNIRSKIANLKLSSGETPITFRSRSTKDHIEVALCQNGDSMDAEQWQQIAASVEGTPDIAVRIHRSVLARAIGDPDLRERIVPLLGDAAGSQATGPNLKIANWAIGIEWVALDLTREQAEGVARVAAEESSIQR